MRRNLYIFGIVSRKIVAKFVWLDTLSRLRLQQASANRVAALTSGCSSVIQ